MSFGIHFTAGSLVSAKHKLNEAHAPHAVKALIERALETLQPPAPPRVEAAVFARDEEAPAGVTRVSLRSARPHLIGVLVECYGHMAEPGTPVEAGKSWIDKFVVQPIFE
jgi:hypothetical protein